ncbi:MAG: DNA polymerase [Caldilineaceae bacterium]|nr:DNA polymerase [Caldilineaceae bacterium]
MINVTFLAYIPDPFAVQILHYMVHEPKNEIRQLSALEVSNYDAPILTFDVAALVDDLRRQNLLPPKHILDIAECLRLLVARSRDDGGERLWNIWPQLIHYFQSKVDGDAFQRIVESKTIRPNASEQRRLLTEALMALRLLWDDLKVKLRSVGELERLTSVEWPLQGIFAYRQFAGIRVNAAVARDYLDEIRAKKYESYREVAQILNHGPTGLNFWNIHPYLEQTDVSHLVEFNRGGQLQDAFELAAANSPFASSFLSLVKASRDESIVKRAIGDVERVYPIFHVFGTITGRILVSDPYLQQLRRDYRTLIAPDPNLRIVYLDYAQFEPGVLAGLSDDKHLTAAYNDGDIYIALAQSLFKDPSARPMAKRVFLAFSYGMTPDRIASILVGSTNLQSNRNAYKTTLNAFFENFSMLENYRIKQQQELLENNFVCSLFGNRRLRTGTGMLTLKEQRWAMNHPVQSTASLIFKQALLGISEEIGVDSIILPIHDAVLLQLPDDRNFDRTLNGVEEIMISAFRRHFPKIDARVTVENFCSDSL